MNCNCSATHVVVLGYLTMKNNYGEVANSVSFAEAIVACFKKYFVFEGRASQSEFWYFFLVYWVGGGILDVVAETQQSEPLVLLSLVIIAIGFFPMLSVGCRRLHDINKSGWWQLIPIYNFILWAQESSSESPQTTRSNSNEFKKSNEPFKSSSEKNDLTDGLEELQELYEDGTLSEEQFKKAKKKILK